MRRCPPTVSYTHLDVYKRQVANGVILHQDRRVVLTQRPKKTELQMGENLLRCDKPVLEFRSRRDELKKAAEAGKK